MKKAAFIFGVIGIIIFLLGTLFKILHWPGAGYLLTWGTLFNLIIVMPIIAIFILSGKSTKKGLYFFGALSLFFWIAGGFFKIQHWPASGILLTIGVLLIIVFVILYAIELYKK